MADEYRVNIKGSMQGHYILANSKKDAIRIAREGLPLARNEPLEVHLWKTREKGHFYPNKLTPYARRKMKLKKVS